MIAAAPVCGFVHVVGSVGDLSVVVEAADGTRVALAGPKADDAVGYPGLVCITGTSDGLTIGAQRTIRVSSFRFVGDGKRSPIVGHLYRKSGALKIDTDDGHRFNVRLNLPGSSDIEAFIGRRVWMTAIWHAGAMEIKRLGLLGLRHSTH